ncbi:MAG: hypothetical protein ABIJ09_13575 [Pseudomonadota bacterium]
MTTSSTARDVVWPCVDLGGTSLRLLMVRPAARAYGGEVVVRLEERTPRGLEGLLQALRATLQRGREQAQQLGCRVVPALALGTPGRYQRGPDGRRRIAPYSATSLEDHPGEFHDLDLLAALSQSLEMPEDCLFVDNDAVVQGLALVQQLLEGSARASYLGERVVCINPGTGLGGCVAEVSADGEVQVFTDGHVSEISLHPLTHGGSVGELQVHLTTTADASSLWLHVDDGENTRELSLATPAGKQAEDLIAGTGVARIVAGLDRLLGLDAEQGPLQRAAAQLGLGPRSLGGPLVSRCLEFNPTTPEQELARDAAIWIADLTAAALLKLMHVLRDGTPRKTPRFDTWPAADVERIRGVRRFVIGGGIARHSLGGHMVQVAQEAWASAAKEVTVHAPDQSGDAGALGALFLVSPVRRLELEALAS